MKDEKGFTLIEVIVVIAIVAILAAILTPSISKNIDDSKRARAQNESLVIASAISDFYKDNGIWPHYTTAGNPADVRLLYSANGDSGVAGIGSSGYWRSNGGWAANAGRLEDQLITNDPNYSTDASQSYVWRGPYLPEINPDPWTTHYSVNIACVSTPNINPEDGPGNFACWVLSAGPNKTWETSIDQGNIPGQPGAANFPPALNDLNAAAGDDIGTQIK